MSDVDGQFEDADTPCSGHVATANTCPVEETREELQVGTDSEDEDWDLLYDDDDDICADFEEETGDFTKKLNAARESRGVALAQTSRKRATEKTVSAPEGPKAIQVSKVVGVFRVCLCTKLCVVD